MNETLWVLSILLIMKGISELMPVQRNTTYDALIKSYALLYKHDPALIKALIAVESGFNPKAHAKTNKENSRGLGQINESTAKALKVDASRLFEPEYNIMTMSLLIKDIKKRYSILHDIIATYNAGEVNKNNTGSYTNQVYVDKVIKHYLAYSEDFS